MTDLIASAGYGVGGLAVITGAIVLIKSKTVSVNSAAGDELIDKLEKLRAADKEEFDNRLKKIEKQRNDCSKAIASLQGQIDVLKNIPLVDIAAALRNIAHSNDKIVRRLDKSAAVLVKDTKEVADAVQSVADIAAEDRDVLTNQTPKVRAQVNKIMKEKS